MPDRTSRQRLAACCLSVVLGGCGGVEFFKEFGHDVADTTMRGVNAGKDFGISVGAAVTGFTTGFIERLSPGDIEEAEEARNRAIETGEEETWTNPETGASGSVRTTPAEPRPAAPTTVTVAGLVEVDAPMSAVGERYIVTAPSGVNVRGGPGTDYPVLMQMSNGQRFDAIAKLQEEDWYLVGRGDVGEGYVRGDLIGPAPAMYDETAAPAQVADTRQVDVSMSAECYTTTQSVSLADGTTEEATVTQCRTPKGWVQV